MLGMYAQEPPVIVAKKADYQVLARNSGTVYTTIGATGAIVFTLPPITDGPFHFIFINGVDKSMSVNASTADTMLTMNDVAADGIQFNTTAERIGGMVEVWCDGTTLFGFARLATEAQTPTLNT
jgi:hypothetical protein